MELVVWKQVLEVKNYDVWQWHQSHGGKRERLFLLHVKPPQGRPLFRTEIPDVRGCFRDEVHHWFKESGSDYQMEFQARHAPGLHQQIVLLVDNPQLAALFQLTWM